MKKLNKVAVLFASAALAAPLIAQAQTPTAEQFKYASGADQWRDSSGEPWRNGYVESFNSRLRDECLNINIFWSLAQARVVIADWKEDYNTRRRHSSLGYQPPAVYAAGCTHR